MPKNALCVDNHRCKIRDKCKRNIIKPYSENQYYANLYTETDEECPNFIPN